jgi:hypothetical protein
MSAASLSVRQVVPVGTRKALRQFFAAIFAAPSRRLEDEVVDYLARHQHDLPPELRITLERHFLSP